MRLKPDEGVYVFRCARDENVHAATIDEQKIDPDHALQLVHSFTCELPYKLAAAHSFVTDIQLPGP
jgi:hypothetical protein